MKEDAFIESLVKSALEDGPNLAERRLQAVLAAAAREQRGRRVRRLLVRWGGPALLAASLALVAALRAPVSSPESAGEAGLAEAIGLLRELDGVAGEKRPGETTGELLLAWQEAPYADLLSADELL